MSRDLFQKLLLSVVTTIVILVVLEGGARLIFPIQSTGSRLPEEILEPESVAALQSDFKLLRFNLEPFVLLRTAPNQQLETMKINSRGLRGPEIGPKSPDTVRVVLLGGSFAFGWGATAENKTIASQLEQMLNQVQAIPGKRFEVINAAQPSYISGQELALFQWQLLALSPDLVIILDGLNDSGIARRNGGPDIPDGVPLTRAAYNHYTGYSVRSWFVYGLRIALKRSRLLSKLWSVVHRAPEASILSIQAELWLKDPSHFDAVKAAYYRNHYSLIRVAQSRDIRVLMALQPVLGLGKKLVTPYEQATLEQRAKRFPPWKEVLTEGYTVIAAAQAELQQKTGVAVLDLRSVFDSEQTTLYIDTGHVSDRGNALVADALAKGVGILYK
ncbi:MAG: SGNH/GDSL hydrolase family protein [Dehalococcoidia bacterium]|nr:SGNH/GDSL hydrolase family protein [Dehalococcoidia bacterium]